MDDSIIVVDNVIKEFGQGQTRVLALKGISLRIFKGEFVIVFGPSGSGKSTLLNIVSGLDQVTNGKIIIDNVDLSNLSSDEQAEFHREKVGIVFQAYNLVPTYTVMQNITLPLAFAGVDLKERKHRAQKLLDDFKLSSLGDRLPAEISGGQQQRVGIMRALVASPPILIADEPTGNLDSITSRDVMRVFRDLNENLGVTVLVVTHDPTQFQWADRVIHVLDGQIVKQTIYHDRVYYSSLKQESIVEVRTHEVEKTLEGDVMAGLAEEGEKHPKTDEKQEEMEGEEGPGEGETKEEKEALEVLSAFSSLIQKKDQLNPQSAKILDLLPIVLDKEQLETYSETDLLALVEAIRLRTINKLTDEDFLTFLDRPRSKGGLGLYRQTSEKISMEIQTLINLFGYQRPIHDKDEYKPGSVSDFDLLWMEKQYIDEENEKILELLGYWLTTYQLKHLSKEQLEMIIQGIRLRVGGIFSAEELQRYFDTPIDMGGAGLYAQSAQHLANEVQSLISLFTYLDVHPDRAQLHKDKLTPRILTAFDALWINKSHLDMVSERILEVLNFVLDSRIKHRLTEDELRGIIQALRYRIENKLTNDEFKEYLDISQSKGGVGLYKQTALKISTEFDRMQSLFNMQAEPVSSVQDVAMDPGPQNTYNNNA